MNATSIVYEVRGAGAYERLPNFRSAVDAADVLAREGHTARIHRIAQDAEGNTVADLGLFYTAHPYAPGGPRLEIAAHPDAVPEASELLRLREAARAMAIVANELSWDAKTRPTADRIRAILTAAKTP